MFSLQDFDYVLPEELIAQAPLPRRTASRLLHVDKIKGTWHDALFTDLPDFLRPGDLLVFNNTKVIPARLYGVKPTGGNVEILIERILDNHRVLAQTRSNHPLKEGQEILLAQGEISLQVLSRQGRWVELICSLEKNWPAILEALGEIPLPPYIRRKPNETDPLRYQTIYAQSPGAAAAPTAGLHFDHDLLEKLAALQIQTAFLTLHVGAGTFLPVHTEDLSKHIMHKEWMNLTESVCLTIEQTKARGGRVIAVGTTVVRSLESAFSEDRLTPYQGETQIFVRPGYSFRVVDALITNFHLPKSTLLMLVCALGGYHPIMAAYHYAIEKRYRFFSYGDAMLIL